MLLRADRRLARWFAVLDPARIGRRVTVSGASPAYLYVVGRRIAESSLFDVHPQQSDYIATWSSNRRLLPRLRGIPSMPLAIQDAYTWFLLLARRPNPSGIQPVALSELASLGSVDADPADADPSAD
jgi:hypothetical protein